jgi:hypothetical protein
MVSVPYRFTGWKEAPEWGFHIGIGKNNAELFAAMWYRCHTAGG